MIMPITGVPGFYVRIMRSLPKGPKEHGEEVLWDYKLTYTHITAMKGHLWPDEQLEDLCKKYKVDDMVIFSHGPDPANEEGSIKFANWWSAKGLPCYVLPFSATDNRIWYIEPYTVTKEIHLAL